MAIHALAQYICIFMLADDFVLIMAIEACPGRRDAWMAGGTHSVGAMMIHWESVVKICRQPGTGGMAGGTLTVKMVGRAAINMTTDAVGGTDSLVVKYGIGPGSGRMAE